MPRTFHNTYNLLRVCIEESFCFCCISCVQLDGLLCICYLHSSDYASSHKSIGCGLHADRNETIVGTLDVVRDVAASREILRGNDRNAMYMINVCVADVARRRGVGQKLVTAALDFARNAGVHHHGCNLRSSTN
jgi:ribosomal protein S18 acetylase RimI-like enzyme